MNEPLSQAAYKVGPQFTLQDVNEITRNLETWEAYGSISHSSGLNRFFAFGGSVTFGTTVCKNMNDLVSAWRTLGLEPNEIILAVLNELIIIRSRLEAILS